MRHITVLRAAVAVAAFLALAAGAAALSTSGGQAIRGCYKTHGGALRITSSRCARGERAISWNSAGPTGASGVNGTNGTNGVNGVSPPATQAIETDWNDANHAINVGTSSTAVLSESVPAGAYSIAAEVVSSNHTDTSSTVLDCTLTAGSDVATAETYVPGTGTPMSMTLPVALTHTFAAAGTVSLACQRTINSGSAFITYASLIATQVGSQTRTQLHG